LPGAALAAAGVPADFAGLRAGDFFTVCRETFKRDLAIALCVR
jgi:hypothetical protein